MCWCVTTSGLVKTKVFLIQVSPTCTSLLCCLHVLQGEHIHWSLWKSSSWLVPLAWCLACHLYITHFLCLNTQQHCNAIPGCSPSGFVSQQPTMLFQECIPLQVLYLNNPQCYSRLFPFRFCISTTRNAIPGCSPSVLCLLGTFPLPSFCYEAC